MSTRRDSAALRAILARLDGRGYRAYREIEGPWELDPGWILHIDHAQADPFARPSRLHLEVRPEATRFGEDLLTDPVRRLALRDYLLRSLSTALLDEPGFDCTRPGPEILDRTDIDFDGDRLSARCTVELPASGRRILGHRAAALLTQNLPACARTALVHEALDPAALRAHVDCLEDQRALRSALDRHSLVGFLGDGAVLPRRSGVSSDPRTGPEVVPLRAPATLAVELNTPHAGRLRGLAIPRGVTLICGGAFHGKSTLLDAIAMGVYDHLPGDGRERCVTRADATVHRAEPGRWIAETDLRAFFRPLPGGLDPARFRSENASGSTSQAASILEGIEAGSRVLLLDEDTSAGNLLAQDSAMRELLGEDDEPILHLSRRLRQLHVERGVSTILVLGSSGAAFDQAERVIQMVEFQPKDVTARALASAQPEAPSPPPWPFSAQRWWHAATLRPGRGRHAVKVRVHGGRELELGVHRADLRAWPQLVDAGQLRAIGAILGTVAIEADGADVPLANLLTQIESRLEIEGLTWVRARAGGELARVRRQDLAAVLVRLRGTEMGYPVAE